MNIAHTLLQWPPYTCTLPADDTVLIVVGDDAWSAADTLRDYNKHALVCSGTPLDFRWPVNGRDVVLFDAGTTEPLLTAFARHLIKEWGARTVEAYGDFEPIRFEGVCHAA